MNRHFFITGISTEVGKTLVSAIVTEALEADYWKPIQSGDLDDSDSHKIERLISNPKTKIHPNSYALKTPMSPHAAADIDGVRIDTTKIVTPQTANDLVIEGAGGLLVPLNEKETIADLIKPGYKVILVSRNYLGSINHTLLSVEALKHRGSMYPVFSSAEMKARRQKVSSSRCPGCLLSEGLQKNLISIRRWSGNMRIFSRLFFRHFNRFFGISGLPRSVLIVGSVVRVLF